MPSPYRNDYQLGALGVNNNTRAIFDLMRSRMDEKNLVHLSVEQKLNFMAKTTSKAVEPLDAFKTILIALKKADVIRCKSGNAFMINPNYGIRYDNSAKLVREQWNKLSIKKRESNSRKLGTTVPQSREPDYLKKGTTVPPLKLVK